MKEPTFDKGTLNYLRDEKHEAIEFYYPNVSWSCIECGNCCGDLDDRSRMILLLPEDINRIESSGFKGFYEGWNERNFTGLMCKEDGKCVFYNRNRCSIYENRSLLCRMYPFWLEKHNEYFLFGIDNECPGSSEGEHLEEGFFADLLRKALDAMDY
jgi:Fe-S-cluster containining protein